MLLRLEWLIDFVACFLVLEVMIIGKWAECRYVLVDQVASLNSELCCGYVRRIAVDVGPQGV